MLPGVPNPFTYMPVHFPTEWLLSATAADERRPMNMHAVWMVSRETKTNGRQWPLQIVRVPVPNEKITNVL